jgi:hypothetical protein
MDMDSVMSVAQITPQILFAAQWRSGRCSGAWSGRRSICRNSSRCNKNNSPKHRRNIHGRKHPMRERAGTKSGTLDAGDLVEAPGLALMGHTSAAVMEVDEVEDLVVVIKDGILAVEVTITSNHRYLSRLLHNLTLYHSLVLII